MCKAVNGAYTGLEIIVKGKYFGQIHQSHAIGGVNGSAMVMMFVDCSVGG
jgi:hypothetical protein